MVEEYFIKCYNIALISNYSLPFCVGVVLGLENGFTGLACSMKKSFLSTHARNKTNDKPQVTIICSIGAQSVYTNAIFKSKTPDFL